MFEFNLAGFKGLNIMVLVHNQGCLDISNSSPDICYPSTNLESVNAAPILLFRRLEWLSLNGLGSESKELSAVYTEELCGY